MKSMKWWGWGDEAIEFDISVRPGLWTYIRTQLRLPERPESTPPVSFDSLVLPEAKSNEAFLTELNGLEVTRDKKERLVHAYGKSYRDLWRLRRGQVDYAPDAVVYPKSHDEVVRLVQAAVRHGVCLIPFGGGSNIAGCLEPAKRESRMVVSVDMRAMRKLLSLDRESGVARAETGFLGPDLEEALQQQGFTLGHFPDSFLFSTLGGWVATRSAGMQSDRYGKIEDMVLAVRMVTPAGTVETRPVPKASNGIDVTQLCVGSEGTLGILTEVYLKVRPTPPEKATYGYLFPAYEQGIAAIQQCSREGCVPVLTRLNDPHKTALSFAYRSKQPSYKQWLSAAVKGYLKHVRRFDFESCCLLLVGFEGTSETVERERAHADAVYQQHGAFALGAEPGKAFQAGKYDFPYLRDFLCDRGVVADVSETATSWSQLQPLYRAATDAIQAAMDRVSSAGWVGCHISHTYPTGASLYFTFGFVGRPGEEMAQYLQVKKAAEDAFLAHGATLSHHHAVGVEHLPWLEADISTTGLRAVEALKQGLDPTGVMNPGKLSSGYGFDDWGLDR